MSSRRNASVVVALGVAALAATSLAAMVATSELLAESFGRPVSGRVDPPIPDPDGPGVIQVEPPEPGRAKPPGRRSRPPAAAPPPRRGPATRSRGDGQAGSRDRGAGVVVGVQRRPARHERVAVRTPALDQPEAPAAPRPVSPPRPRPAPPQPTRPRRRSADRKPDRDGGSEGPKLPGSGKPRPADPDDDPGRGSPCDRRPDRDRDRHRDEHRHRRDQDEGDRSRSGGRRDERRRDDKAGRRSEREGHRRLVEGRRSGHDGGWWTEPNHGSEHDHRRRADRDHGHRPGNG